MIVDTKARIMTKEEEVSLFLAKYHALMKNYGICFYRHPKNFLALLDSEMSSKGRESFIKGLTSSHYYRGPAEDKHHPGTYYWEFGIQIKGKEWYIKLSLGTRSGPVWCFSFHPAERKIYFPYKHFDFTTD